MGEFVRCKVTKEWIELFGNDAEWMSGLRNEGVMVWKSVLLLYPVFVWSLKPAWILIEGRGVFSSNAVALSAQEER